MEREPGNETPVDEPEGSTDAIDTSPESAPESASESASAAKASREKRLFIPEELRIRRLRLVVRLFMLGAILIIGLWSISQLQKQLYYYDQLMIRCVQLKDRSCCWASVRAMREGSFKLVKPENDWRKQCPKGESPHTLRCDSSYQWCAPTH